MNIERFFEWFVPAKLVNNMDKYQKAHIIIRFSWYGLPFFLLNAFKWSWAGHTHIFISLVIVTSIIWLMAFVVRYTGSTFFAGNGILVALCWHFTYLSYHTGGIASYSLSWILVIPGFSMMLVGMRSAFFWSAMMGLAIVVFYLLTSLGHTYPLIQMDNRGILIDQLSNSLGPFLTLTILGCITAIGIKRAIKTQNEAMEVKKKARNLENLFFQVQRSGLQVTSSANQLSAVASQQEMTMERQTESIENVLFGVEEISRLTTELFETMQKVVVVSQETAKFASTGKSELVSMEKAMHEMEGSSHLISRELKTIHDKAESITAVVTTITKVADQTNLLSFNAAIEAEKAGKYGKGFNVISREIRRLADQTAVATLDIERMISEMQIAVNAGVEEMNNSISDVQDRSRDVDTIRTHMAHIIEQVQQLSPRFEMVNEAMGIQSKSAIEVRDSMANLKSEMEHIMKSLKESYFAIEQLNEAVHDLNREVSLFDVDLETAN